MGRDCSSERLTPRVENCSSSSSRAPERSSGSSAMMLVLSAPVAGGKTVLRETSTNRVTALALSEMFSASTSSAWCCTICGGATAASARSFSNSDSAAATFEVDGMWPWAGKCESSHLRVCA